MQSPLPFPSSETPSGAETASDADCAGAADKTLDVLLEGLRNGDSNAWDGLLKRYGGLVLSIARSAGLDDAASEDVFQETWVALYAQAKYVRQAGALPGWIAVTARRSAWRMRRRERLRRTREERVEFERQRQVEQNQGGDLLEETVELERRQEVWDALAALSERCRMLIEFLHLAPGDTSYSEVAKRLQIPVGSVGPTRQRCLERLAVLLERAADTRE